MAHREPCRRALLLASLVLAVPAWAQDGDNAPIPVHVASPLTKVRGFSRLLGAAAEGNTEESARDLERELAGVRWIRRVGEDEDPEVVVHVERRDRTETNRRTDKNGKVTIDHKYRIAGLVDFGTGSRVPFAHETSRSETEGSYRNDSSHFRDMADELAADVLRAIATRLDELRPNRAEAGLSVEPKYRFLFKGDGLDVLAVDSGSPAERAGLRVGDRIRRIGKEKGTGQMLAITQSWWIDGPGARYLVEYERDKRRQTVEVVLETPQRAGDAAAEVSDDEAEPATGRTRATAPADVQLRVGMSEAELERALGKPAKKVTYGAKSVWTYDAFTVTVLDGRVTDIR